MKRLQELYKELILDHNKNPQNFYKMKNATQQLKGFNPLCGDQITIYLKINKKNIKDISFQGSGCAISKASASLMTLTLKGKTKTEIKKIFKEFEQLIKNGQGPSSLGKLLSFAGLHKFPSRFKCAFLAWSTLAELLQIKLKNKSFPKNYD